jgi:HEPN domain-containing protein
MKNSYNEWINRARSSLNIAKELNHEGIYLEDLCFQAQQAAEKALKAVMIFLSIRPPYTHNLNTLLLQLNERIKIPEDISDVIDLNDYAVQTPYPGDFSPIEMQEYQNAIKIAESTVNWAEDYIEKNS